MLCLEKKTTFLLLLSLNKFQMTFFFGFVFGFLFVCLFVDLKTTSNLSKLETPAVAFAHFLYILGLLDLG